MDIADAKHRIQLAKAEGYKIRAIIPVHYGGQIGDVESICQLADQFNLKIIEDAAHCCPAFFRTVHEEEWQSVGSFSDISCYSFYANKTITTGEGGMACTVSGELEERMRMMSLHGISNDPWDRFSSKDSWYYEIIAPGFKYNMTDIASSIGIHQLRKADQFHRRRQSIAALYSEILEDVEEVIPPAQQPNRIHSWHLYVIRLRLEKLSIDRGQFIKELRELGVTVSVHWMPLHMHPYYQKTYGFLAEDYPVSSRIYSEIVSLPIFPDLTEEEVRYVVEQIKKVIGEHRRPVSVRIPGSSSV
jgi:perosamine synthetase